MLGAAEVSGQASEHEKSPAGGEGQSDISEFLSSYGVIFHRSSRLEYLKPFNSRLTSNKYHALINLGWAPRHQLLVLVTRKPTS